MNHTPSVLSAVWINPDGRPEQFSCGCTANAHPGWPGNPCYEFRFCALHQSAPLLLAALKDIVGRYDVFNAVCRWCGRRPMDLYCTSDDCPGFQARAAIDKAEEGLGCPIL